MLYTIENEFLKVDINDEGAQMMSLVGKKTGFEYLWQGDATFWASRATVLFPICGRLTDGKVDDFATKNEMMHLARGEKKNISFTVTVNE